MGGEGRLFRIEINFKDNTLKGYLMVLGYMCGLTVQLTKGIFIKVIVKVMEFYII